MKKVKIDYLFLDAATCQRCIETQKTLDAALNQVKTTLEKAGYDFMLNRVHIESTDQAKEWQFVSSPTIRVNNQDIAPALIESQCEDCGDLCGCGEETQCRAWEFEGAKYDVPPEPLVVDRILHTLYNTKPAQERSYSMPDNLKNYFNGKEAKKEPAAEACCGPACCG